MALGRDIRRKVFKHVGQYALQEFDEVGTASLITRTTNDITQIQQVVIMMLRMVTMHPIMFLAGLILAILRNGPLQLEIIAVIPILIIAIFFILKKEMPLLKTVQKGLKKLKLFII